MTGEEFWLGQSVFEWLSAYGYYVLPILIIFLGPVAGFTAGFFASLGALNPFIVFLVWFFTTTTTDALLFSLGKFGRGLLNRFKRSRGVVEKIDMLEHGPGVSWVNFIKEHYIKLFFFVKISPTVTISDMLAVVGGLLDVEFKRHYIASIMGQMIWSGVFVSMGYYFGGAIQDTSFLINTTGIILGSIFIITVIYIKFLHKHISQKFDDVLIRLKDLFINSGSGENNYTKK